MAANPCPRHTGKLRSFADHLLEGAHLHGEDIDLKQNDEAAMREAIATAAQAELEAGQALTHRAATYQTLDAADVAGRATLSDCKLRLAQKMGQRWSAAWEATGFPERSTAVPRTMDPRYVLLGSLKLYFTSRPEHESADHSATAAQCEAAWKVIHDARLAVNLAESAVTKAIRARRAAVKALRKRCRGLVVELWVLLPRDDARYQSFGLKIPASRAETPATEAGDGG
jgi:hypothetical protein